MYTIKENVKNEIIIKNSKFLCLLKKINTKEEVEKYLEEIKLEYPKATHYCYAYILNELKKSSDDKEPSGTAGLPILNVLEKENLTSILCIVIRYFGGIKLGAGGLVRAYSKSAKHCLEKAQIIELIKGYLLEITIPYEEIKSLEYLTKNQEVVEKKFESQVKYIIKVSKEFLSTLDKSKTNYKIIKEIYIEKEPVKTDSIY